MYSYFLFFRLTLLLSQLIGDLCILQSKWNWVNFSSVWHICLQKIPWQLEYSRQEISKQRISTANQVSCWQLPAVKEDTFFGATRKIFGPSYFVTALAVKIATKDTIRDISFIWLPLGTSHCSNFSRYQWFIAQLFFFLHDLALILLE